jgi:hypothetical protein
MSNDTYLTIFLGSKTSSKMMAWNSLSEAERRAKERLIFDVVLSGSFARQARLTERYCARRLTGIPQRQVA